MKNIFTAAARFFLPCIATVIFMTVNQGVARADTITFQGTTDAVFNSMGFSSNPTLLGLTFNGANFPIGTVDTSAVTLSLVGPTITIGSFTLAGNFPNSPGNTFGLRFVVTFPAGVDGRTQPSAFFQEANILTSPDGSVTIDFLFNDPIPFVVEVNGIQIASFALTIPDIHIEPGQTVAVVGTLEDVPEPATLLLLGSGLAGVGAAVWKRRKIKVG